MTPGALPSWVGDFEEISKEHFGIPPEMLIEAFMGSANARGYLLGAVSELILAAYLVENGYFVKRIREKWEGTKLHHGDFYVSKDSKNWFVVESKGLKSNSRKWHRVEGWPSSPAAIERWIARRRRGEIGQWWARVNDERKKRILGSGIMNQAVPVETHFVSGTAGRSGRTIATPRKTEFHVVSLDLYLATGSHEFIFAASGDLEASEGSPDHLKQNYLIDIIVPPVDAAPVVEFPWVRDFDGVFARLANPVRTEDMQVDERKRGERQIDT